MVPSSCIVICHSRSSNFSSSNSSCNAFGVPKTNCIVARCETAFFRSWLYDDERNFQLRSKMAPAPLAPYPTVSAPFPPPTTGAQSQLVCSGCQNLLLYPVGATSICCAICNAVTSAPPPGAEMAQLVCGGCHTLLMYIRGATSVQCSCCHTVNLALEANQVAHVNCGNCRMLLMYQYGAPSVKCAVCNFVTSIRASTNATEQKFNS